MVDDSEKPDAPADGSGLGTRRRSCIICARPQVMKYRPFCSRRCADIDLGRWFKGDYRVPAVEPPDGEDSEAIEMARGTQQPNED